MVQKSRHIPNSILRRLREERGWSLQRVADELRLLAEAEDETHIPGVNANMVGVWERGWKRPSPYYQTLFCQLYARPASQLGFIDEEAIPAPRSSQKSQVVSHPTSFFPPVPQLTLAHEQTRAIDLLCSHQETTSEQQAGAWLTLGASGLSQLFTEGWTIADILTSLQLVLQSMQALPPMTRRQLLQLGGTALVSSIPVPAGERPSEEERIAFTRAMGECIGEAWKLFHTTSNAQVLAVGQALLCLVRENHTILDANERPRFYTGIYNLIGKALSFQEQYHQSLQAHTSAYLAALQAGASWDMLQTMICQSDDYHALGQYDRAIQILEEALRIASSNPTNVAHLRSKAHLLACWADNAITLGDRAVVQEKLDASATFLEQIGPHEEFDNASWLQLAGKYAFMTGDYAKTIKCYEQALAEVPSDWVLRRTLIVIPTIVAYACQHEREASLKMAEQALSALNILNAPTLNRQFHVAIYQALAGVFQDDRQVQDFIATAF